MKRMPGRRLTLAAVVAVLGAVAGAVRPLAAQGAGWSVRQSRAMDLWFHGVALVGFDRLVPLPLYRNGYAAEIRRDREARGQARTRLERDRDALLAAFRTDSAFEVLHFLPLYFAAAGDAMLEALARVSAEGERAIPALAPPTRFGAAAALLTLPRPEARRLLGQFVAELDTEWTAAYATEWRAAAEREGPAIAEAERRWRSEFEPALRPFLHRYRLDGGVIFVVASLGPDGRIFEGAPRARDDNVIVVALPPDGDAAGILHEAVRELCFPAVRASVTASMPAADRTEQASSNATVRCGDILLSRYLPAAREGYRSFWLRHAASQPTLEAAYPIAPGRAAALAGVINRAR